MRVHRKDEGIRCLCGHLGREHLSEIECAQSVRGQLSGTRMTGADKAAALIKCGCRGFCPDDCEDDLA